MKSDLDKGGGSGAWRCSGRHSARKDGSDHNQDAFEDVFKDVFTAEEIAKADASQIWEPAGFDSGDGL